MKIVFDKLWDMLSAQKLTRTQFRIKAGISAVTLAKLGRDEKVSHATLTKICRALDCDLFDIMSCGAQFDNLAVKYKKTVNG